MAKKDDSLNWIIGIALIIIVIYGGQQGWFKSILNINNPGGSLTPSPNQAALSSCTSLCSQEKYTNSKNSLTDDGSDCSASSIFYKYGYPNQLPILKCCCWNINTPTSCTDSDGDNRDTVGHVTYLGEIYYDKCLDVGQAVTEYICENNQVKAKNWMCDYGEICMQTRSGGHCIKAPKVWKPGDTVYQGSGSGDISGAEIGLAELDLGLLGITPGGNCRLGAQIQTDWQYITPQCTGIQGMEGLKWEFFDSLGLEYSRIDPVPLALGVDINPGNGHTLDWDGSTKWVGKVSKMLNIPGCVIHDNWNIRIYIYDCT